MGTVSALVSLTTASSQVGFLKQLLDLESAQIREILREREKVDRLTVDGIRNELDWIKQSIQRLDRRSSSSGSSMRFALVSGDLTDPNPAAPVPPETTKIQAIEEELRLMRIERDAYLVKLKEGKLTEVQRSRMHSLEIDYEIKRMQLRWQVWCGTSFARRLQCEDLYGD